MCNGRSCELDGGFGEDDEGKEVKKEFRKTGRDVGEGLLKKTLTKGANRIRVEEARGCEGLLRYQVRAVTGCGRTCTQTKTREDVLDASDSRDRYQRSETRPTSEVGGS